MSEVVVVEPVAVKIATAARMLDIGTTKCYELIKAGRLKTIRIGSDLRVTVESIRNLAKGGAA